VIFTAVAMNRSACCRTRSRGCPKQHNEGRGGGQAQWRRISAVPESGRAYGPAVTLVETESPARSRAALEWKQRGIFDTARLIL